jgi:hypothetical protein
VGDDQQQADPDSDALEDDHAPEGVAGFGSFSAPAGHRQQAERGRHHADPDPLATVQLEAEEALGEHRKEDQASREHRLADRERGERERGHVQRERHGRHAPADAPPLRPEEIGRAAQRMAHVDVGSGDRPPVLEQEREVRSQRGQQRADKANADGQRDVGHRGAAAFRALIEAGVVPPAAGPPLLR